jgi:hypothetical protein
MKARHFGPEPEIAGPGPGRYNPNYEFVMPQDPKTQIRTKWTEAPKPPGVGYLPAPPSDTGLKITIGRRIEDKIVPGA